MPENLAFSPLVAADVAEPTAFDNSASAQKGLKFAWDFGDGQSSSEASPKHSYAKPGDYTVTLKVSNDGGQSRELKTLVSVNNQSAVRGFECSGANASGWCWQAPLPTGNRVLSSWFVDSQTGWRVGRYGEIFKTTDGGNTWARQASGVTVNLFSVQFASKDVGWALGSGGVLLNTRDGGANWRLVLPGTRVAEYVGNLYMNVRSVDIVELFADSTLVLSTKDGGKTWKEISSPYGMQLAPDGSYWTFGGSRVQKRDSAEASTRTVLDLGPDFISSNGHNLIFVNDRTVLAYASRTQYDSVNWRYVTVHTLWRSTDAGANWTNLSPAGLPNDSWPQLNQVASDATGQTLLGVVGNKLMRSTDFGSNWTEVTGLPFKFSDAYSLRVVDGRLVYWSSYESNGMYVSDDQGKSWKAWTVPEDASNTGGSWWPSFVDSRTMVLNAYGGRVFLLSDEGRTSKLIMEGVSGEGRTHAVGFFDSKRGFMLTYEGELRGTVDGGKTWSVKRRDLGMLPGSSEERLQVVSDKIGYLLGADGRLYRSEDAGETWRSSLAGSFGWTRFAFADANNGWASGSNSTLGRQGFYLTRDAGTTWNLLASPTLTNALYVDAGRTITVVGRAGFVAQSDDEGKTWQPRFSGVSVDLNKLYSRDGKQLWALTANGTGYVLRSDDGGQSWNKLFVPSPSALKDIRFLDSQYGWIVGDAGTVLFTKDGGTSWQPQKSGTERSLRRVQFTDLRTGWIVGENGGLLATGTGGN